MVKLIQIIDFQNFRENLANPEHEAYRESRAPKENLEVPDKKALMVPKEILVCLDLKETEDYREMMDKSDLKDLLDCPVLWVIKVAIHISLILIFNLKPNP